MVRSCHFGGARRQKHKDSTVEVPLNRVPLNRVLPGLNRISCRRKKSFWLKKSSKKNSKKSFSFRLKNDFESIYFFQKMIFRKFFQSKPGETRFKPSFAPKITRFKGTSTVAIFLRNGRHRLGLASLGRAGTT